MTAELLKSKVPATCVVASNDMAAWGCISELRNAGLRVPEDMSVVGADGIPVPGIWWSTPSTCPRTKSGWRERGRSAAAWKGSPVPVV